MWHNFYERVIKDLENVRLAKDCRWHWILKSPSYVRSI